MSRKPVSGTSGEVLRGPAVVALHRVDWNKALASPSRSFPFDRGGNLNRLRSQIATVAANKALSVCGAHGRPRVELALSYADFARLYAEPVSLEKSWGAVVEDARGKLFTAAAHWHDPDVVLPHIARAGEEVARLDRAYVQVDTSGYNRWPYEWMFHLGRALKDFAPLMNVGAFRAAGRVGENFVRAKPSLDSAHTLARVAAYADVFASLQDWGHIVAERSLQGLCEVHAILPKQFAHWNDSLGEGAAYMRGLMGAILETRLGVEHRITRAMDDMFAQLPAIQKREQLFAWADNQYLTLIEGFDAKKDLRDALETFRCLVQEVWESDAIAGSLTKLSALGRVWHAREYDRVAYVGEPFRPGKQYPLVRDSLRAAYAQWPGKCQLEELAESSGDQRRQISLLAGSRATWLDLEYATAFSALSAHDDDDAFALAALNGIINMSREIYRHSAA